MESQRLGDYIVCNPTVKLKKGQQCQLTDIDSITIGQKYPISKGLVIYDGQSGSKFSKGDTIMARITPCLENGKIAMYNGEEDSIGSTELFVFRGKEGVSTNEFVYYFFKQDWIRNYAANSMTGASGRQRADIKFIQKAKVQFPPLPIQQKIASILSAYDSQIENNQKRIKLLEQMAENLYKEWFVRFRFPGYETAEFEEGLPKGWKYESFGNLFPIKTGKKDANYSSPNGRYKFFTCSQEALLADNYSFDCFAIILAGNGDFNVKLYDGKFEAYQRTYVLCPYDIKHIFIAFYTIKGELINLLSGAAGAVIKFLTKGMIERVKVIIPDRKTLEQFHQFSICNYRERQALISQNEILSHQRDLLLPRLISGKLSI